MQRHDLEERILAAQNAGRTTLIPFVTAGFPTPDAFWDVLYELDASGADIIEIGVPFSDPVADGPVVEAASVQALQNGVTLRGLMADLRARKGQLKAGLVLMGYLNPFLQYGFERFARDAAEAGIHGCIVPDLPLEEAAGLQAALNACGIALIPLVGPNTSAERMALYAKTAQGYVYVVSVMGTTGERGALPPELPAVLARARQAFRLPVALGFGLKEPAQLDSLPPTLRPEAAVFGSALLKHLSAGHSPASFMQRWTQPR